MTQEHDSFSLVISGAMNPAIHSPEWYERQGVISEAERDQALQDRTLLRNPVGSQFTVGDISIVCDETRWEMRTSAESLINRVVEIACKVFERLDETPVGAFGLNYSYHIDAGVQSVGRVLFDRVSDQVGVKPPPDGDACEGRIGITLHNTARTLSMSIEQSRAEQQRVYIGFNYHVVPRTEGKYNLTPLLKDALEKSQAEIGGLRGGALAALTAAGGT